MIMIMLMITIMLMIIVMVTIVIMVATMMMLAVVVMMVIILMMMMAVTHQARLLAVCVWKCYLDVLKRSPLIVLRCRSAEHQV